MRTGLASLLLIVVFLVVAADVRADYANPVLPGDYPDPSVVQVGEDYYATATSDRWAPVFPVLHSRDLISWEQVGAVFDVAPTWATGRRFWAPQISFSDGRFVVLFAGLKQNGKFCIGAATAIDPSGPWTDEGPVVCPAGGAIDPTSVVREDGTTWMFFKAQGVNGGLFAQQIDLRTFDVLGAPVPLIAPDRDFERRVTEGPTVFKEGPWWYLVYSGGGCCKPPCGYVQAVARSTDLLGPYIKRDAPILVGGDQWRCPGHGTVFRLADGSLQLLHHSYMADDVLNRRRFGQLTPVSIDGEGWPAVGTGVATLQVTSPLGTLKQPGPALFRDAFDTLRLQPGWQSVIRREVPQLTVGDRRLRLECGGSGALVTRQVAVDRFALAATVQPPRGRARPALVVRERDGTQRGIEVRNGSVRSLQGRGISVQLGAPVAIPRDRPVRLLVTVSPGGGLATWVKTAGGNRRIPAGAAAFGVGPTRFGLACRGRGTAVLSNLRLSGDGTAPVGVPAVPFTDDVDWITRPGARDAGVRSAPRRPSPVSTARQRAGHPAGR